MKALQYINTPKGNLVTVLVDDENTIARDEIANYTVTASDVPEYPETVPVGQMAYLYYKPIDDAFFYQVAPLDIVETPLETKVQAQLLNQKLNFQYQLDVIEKTNVDQQILLRDLIKRVATLETA